MKGVQRGMKEVLEGFKRRKEREKTTGTGGGKEELRGTKSDCV